MSEPARNRFALDLDDLERQLRGAGQAPKPGHAVDPLAELTRIVGQDDPLKNLFAQRNAAAPAQAGWQQARPEPPLWPAAVPAAVSPPPAEVRGALDEFEALLRRTEVARPALVAEASHSAESPAYAAADGRAQPAAYAPEPDAYANPEPGSAYPVGARDLDQEHADAYREHYGRPLPVDDADLPEDDVSEPEPRRSRKGLWTAVGLVAVGIIGVGAAMAFRGAAPSVGGQPPVIAADTGPTKVVPANPGGAEIPNQTKQIYDRTAETPAGQTKIVSREEQPVDVQQAARTLPARVVLPGPTVPANVAPAQNGAVTGGALALAPAAPDRSNVVPAEPLLTPVPPVPGLGEPRRVRTVSIRPDGTPAPAASANAAYANGSAPVATGSTPARPAATPPVVNPSVAAPTTTASTGPVRRPTAITPDPPKVQERIVAPATTPSAPLRLANNAATPATPPTPAVAAVRSGSGDFAVQLAAPGSESEARATYTALQRKYPGQLGGQAPIVRKTELAGGKTVFRLRVGPYSREDAATMCTQLQAAGGQCFIAKN